MKVEIERADCDFVRELPGKSIRIILTHHHKLEEPAHAPVAEEIASEPVAEDKPQE
jgi:hypothetical protein